MGSHTPPIRLLNYNSRQSGAAVLKGTKRKIESDVARSGPKNQRGKVTKQSDVQKGSVKQPLSDNQLMDIQKWFLLGIPSTPKIKRQNSIIHKLQMQQRTHFVAARDRALLNFQHNVIYRGDCIRAETVTMAHIGIFKHNKRIGPDYGYIDDLLKKYSKNKQKSCS